MPGRGSSQSSRWYSLSGVARGGGNRLAPHRVHHGAGQDQGPAAGGIAMGAVQTAGPQVRGFQVGGDLVAVQGRVVSAQQRGAQTVALPVRADGQQGQVVVGGPGGGAAVQFLVKGPEPAGPGTGDGGEPLIVALGRGRGFLAGGQPQRDGVTGGGGAHEAVSQGVLDVKAEVTGEDLVAGGRVGDQPPGDRQVGEGAGDDLAEDADAGLVG